jgi:hypothetical protein
MLLPWHPNPIRNDKCSRACVGIGVSIDMSTIVFAHFRHVSHNQIAFGSLAPFKISQASHPYTTMWLELPYRVRPCPCKEMSLFKCSHRVPSDNYRRMCEQHWYCHRCHSHGDLSHLVLPILIQNVDSKTNFCYFC